MIIWPAKGEVHNAKYDFEHDSDDAGDNSMFHFPSFFVFLSLMLLAGFLPVVYLFRRKPVRSMIHFTVELEDLTCGHKTD